MKIKTSELSGVSLDWAVAKAMGMIPSTFSGGMISDGAVVVRVNHGLTDWKPSADWSQGGPLIERFDLEIIRHSEGKWCAVKEWTIDVDCNYPEGETPLIAACRAIVASKLGDEVDVPEGLV